MADECNATFSKSKSGTVDADKGSHRKHQEVESQELDFGDNNPSREARYSRRTSACLRKKRSTLHQQLKSYKLQEHHNYLPAGILLTALPVLEPEPEHDARARARAKAGLRIWMNGGTTSHDCRQDGGCGLCAHGGWVTVQGWWVWFEDKEFVKAIKTSQIRGGTSMLWKR